MPSLPATLAAAVDHEIVIRKSRFLAHIVPLSCAEEADDVIASVRRAHWDAAHNCTAQVTGLTGDRARSSDDGEPSGTAGMPMLEVLRRRGLTDVLAVVTRYFGGIKLGAGGLVRAYSSAVSAALDVAALVDRRMLSQVTAHVPHTEAGRVDHALHDWTGRNAAILGEPEYAASARFEVWVPAERIEALQAEIAALTAGAVAAESTGVERVIDVPR